jgi:hypothetical protein
MHGPIYVKSPNNTSKWQMGVNSAFKGLKVVFDFITDNCEYKITNVILVTKANIYLGLFPGPWMGPVQVRGSEA